ncbi:hypothetical protein IT407_05230 [Candidatus Uhrbacteria bacterium]|nr:hypothetical protein [Candidatus Uhrbacteria bacterium]
MSRLYRIFSIAALVLLGSSAVSGAWAASPSGADWFQLLTNQQTGADNTGDGGSGNGDDLNYYYVGQTFTTVMQIRATGPGATAANIWIDYQSTSDTASGLTTGSFFNSWSGQTVSSTISAGVGRVFSTGFNIPVTQSSGTGTFGNVSWTVVRPSAPAYSTSSPRTLDINVGTIGLTTESNISLAGVDILDDEEDFMFNAWADITKPFSETNNVASGATGVLIDADYLFRLFDTKRGQGFSTSTAYNAGGVGTGVNTATPPGVLALSPAHFTPTSFDAYSCSGVWGTNVCNVTMDPPSPLAIVGDTRNWQYNQLYQFCISGYQDFASTTQDQLGDSNGPNTMDFTCYTFTTEPDIVAPQVVSEIPVAGSSGNSVNTNITVNVEDRKTYPSGPSGTGVATTTCVFDVWTTSQATTTYSLPSGLVTINPISYGFQYVINPAVDFPQNERVYVRTTACQDLVGNTMTPDTWFFDTADTDPPYVALQNPANDTIVPTSSASIQLSVFDLGTGVDLSETVIFINGNYYTSGGGAGTVTNVGTLISFTTSSDFTAFVSNTSTNQYNFNFTPLTFTDGEAVPIIVYSEDIGGNLMPRAVYALTAAGTGVCPSGATYCGSNTSWNGSQCIGTATTSTSTSCPSSGGGGGGTFVNEVNQPTVYIAQIDEDSVLVTWTTNRPATSRVVFGKESSTDMNIRPNYGYSNTTPEYPDNDTYHSVIIDGLENGVLYYFRGISEANGVEVYSRELRMAPVFATTIVKEDGEIVGEQPICPVQPPLNPVGETLPTIPAPAIRPSRRGPVPTNVVPQPVRTTPSAPAPAPVSSGSGSGVKITDIQRTGSNYTFKGIGSGKIRVFIVK